MCLYPRLGINPKYKTNSKNGGVIASVSDSRILYVPWSCGECIECRKQKARDWKVRLLEDILWHKNGQFVTLTMSNEEYKKLYDICENKENKTEGYDRDNEIATLAVKRFRERWRKETGKSPRHWLVTELGHKGTENIHLHGVIWTNEHKLISKHWKYGWVWDGYSKNGQRLNYVNEKTIGYTVKYIHKQDLQHKGYKSIVLTSAGIGKNYIKSSAAERNRFRGNDTIETYKMRNGYEIAMPKYLREKLYTEEEREKLWIKKLDEQVRYVLGQKIDVSKNMDECKAMLEIARRTSKEMGYKTKEDKERWKYYENQIRKIAQETRLKKAVEYRPPAKG